MCMACCCGRRQAPQVGDRAGGAFYRFSLTIAARMSGRPMLAADAVSDLSRRNSKGRPPPGARHALQGETAELDVSVNGSVPVDQ